MSGRFLLIGIFAIGVIAAVIYVAIGEPTAEATLSADPTNANLVATG